MNWSKFLIKVKHNGKIVLFNSFARAIIELSGKEYRIACRAVRKKDIDKPVVKTLVDQGFLTEENEVDVLKYNYKHMQFDETNISLTICPTMDCVFRCPYCFEVRKRGKMTKQNQELLLKYIEKKLSKETKVMSVLWFGGEPLMAWDVIQNLSEKLISLCEKNKIKYEGYMISNAYLLDEEKVRKFSDYKIHGMQVTIDGPKRIHDTRRILANGNGTYDTILKNLELLNEYGVRVDVRVNIDKTNANDIEELFEDFQRKNLTFVKFSFGHVIAYTENCKNISCTCLSKMEYSSELIKYYEILQKYNFSRNKNLEIPDTTDIYCGALKKNAYSFDHELNIYRCWNQIGNADFAIGNVKDEQMNSKQRQVDMKYMLWNPIESKKCERCKYLPICMGGCPYLGLKLKESQCDHWKFIIPYLVKKQVEKVELEYSLLNYLNVPWKSAKNFESEEKVKRIIENICDGFEYKIEENNLVVFSKNFDENKKFITVSSHVDAVYKNTFLEEKDDELVGTFDNSLTNFVLIELIKVVENNQIVFVFSSGEEDKNFSIEKLPLLGNKNFRFNICLDVTPYCHSDFFATIENNEHNLLKKYGKTKGVAKILQFQSMTDESTELNKVGKKSVSVCIPCRFNKNSCHDEKGGFVKKQTLEKYFCLLEKILNDV